MYEAPDLRLGSVQAPSVNLTCNATTGEFQPSSMPLGVMLTTMKLDSKRSDDEIQISVADATSAEGEY